jgi:hypothetical protein
MIDTVRAVHQSHPQNADSPPRRAPFDFPSGKSQFARRPSGPPVPAARSVSSAKYNPSRFGHPGQSHCLNRLRLPQLPTRATDGDAPARGRVGRGTDVTNWNRSRCPAPCSYAQQRMRCGRPPLRIGTAAGVDPIGSSYGTLASPVCANRIPLWRGGNAEGRSTSRAGHRRTRWCSGELRIHRPLPGGCACALRLAFVAASSVSYLIVIHRAPPSS